MWNSGKILRVALLLKIRWTYARRKDTGPFFRERYKDLRYPSKSSTYWKSYRNLLYDDDNKSLGVFNVLSDNYWISTREEGIISAWDKSVDDDFVSTISMANSEKEGNDISTEECLRNLQRQYRVTDDDIGHRSALLTHNRFLFVCKLDERIQFYTLEKGKKDAQGFQSQAELYDKIKEVMNIRKTCLKNSKSEDAFKTWFDMIDKNSFLLHLNDTREENTPVIFHDLTKLRPVQCKRIELVTVTFLDGLVADEDFRNSYKWFYEEMSIKDAKDLRSLWNEVITSRKEVNMEKLVEVAMVQWLAYFFAETASKNLNFYEGDDAEYQMDDEIIELEKKRKWHQDSQGLLEEYKDMQIPEYVEEQADNARKTYSDALETALNSLNETGDYLDLRQELNNLRNTDLGEENDKGEEIVETTTERERGESINSDTRNIDKDVANRLLPDRYVFKVFRKSVFSSIFSSVAARK